jgi:hypothetical protein
MWNLNKFKNKSTLTHWRNKNSNTTTVELGYNVMEGTEYFVLL